ncbi:forespore capture DNA-binding protein RefZ [Bacillus sp. JCM 19041]|uniref:forespore capture DNA-binding protein RefZ n=1 Tax=Bacillus sp. JCM 19041 TaxID=1460637 RepID=UPI0012E0E6CF
MMSEQTKASIKEAATALFYANGYHGTSVRDIAKEAVVNPALISYYFGGKQALFETLVTDFFEGYVDTIEQALKQKQTEATIVLSSMFKRVLHYQQSCHWLARMAHREMTLDSTLVREVMSTYLRKEQYLLEQLIARCMEQNKVKGIPVDLVVLQLRNMMTLPFSSPQYLRELFMLTPADKQFIDRYVRHANSWIAQVLQIPERRVVMRVLT